ncbi:MAG TPA: hypothetical protein VM865_05640 [Acidobacteriaceae bacterium]|nr:hypothetical protein [Acidobacteriaceae bacterium]
MPLVLLIVPVLSTLLGGLLALRLRSALSFLMALSAGLLLGAAFLDLLPEAIVMERTAGGTPATVFTLTLVSFLGFLFAQSGLEALIGRDASPRSHRAWGRFGGLLLVSHSFRDGMAIGLSYAASHPAGYIVAAGIAAHDIGDGVSTVLLSTRGERAGRVDYLLLAADALAPLAGGVLTAWFHVSMRGSAALLAITAGFFLQMIAGELLPQLREARASWMLVGAAMLAGVGLIYIANALVA